MSTRNDPDAIFLACSVVLTILSLLFAHSSSVHRSTCLPARYVSVGEPLLILAGRRVSHDSQSRIPVSRCIIAQQFCEGHYLDQDLAKLDIPSELHRVR